MESGKYLTVLRVTTMGMADTSGGSVAMETGAMDADGGTRGTAVALQESLGEPARAQATVDRITNAHLSQGWRKSGKR